MGKIKVGWLNPVGLIKKHPRPAFIILLVLVELACLAVLLVFAYPTIPWDIKIKYIFKVKEAQHLFVLMGLLPAFFLWSWRDGDKKLDIENQRVSNESQNITHNQTNFHKLVDWLLSDDEALQLASVPQFLPFLEGELGDHFKEAAKELLFSFLASAEVERAEKEIKTVVDKRGKVIVRLTPTVQRIHQLIKSHGQVFAKLNLQGIVLTHATLDDSKLQEAKLQEANLERAVLWEAHLEGAHLQKTDLEWADLRKAHLEGAHLEGANLKRAVLWEANLQGARLQRANLQRAVLWETNLQGARLQWANLKGARLWKANLQEANLEGVNLEESHLEGATYNKETTFPEDFDPKEAGMKFVGDEDKTP